MHVLFLTKYYRPAEGGIERYSELICQGIVNAGVKIDVVAAGEPGMAGSTEIRDGVTVHRVRSWRQVGGVPISPFMPSVVRRLSEDCDLIHLNFPNPLADLSFMSIKPPRPAVVTYHSDILRNRLLLRAYRPFIDRLLDRTACIIATSDNYVHSSRFLRTRADRCLVVPLPVDIARLAHVDSGEVKKWVAKFGPYVLFAGRFVYYKGVDVLIEAIASIPKVVLVLVGRGVLEDTFRQQVNRSGISDRVKFLGKVEDTTLTALYHGARCFVLPSTARAEAFGMVLAEAMCCGTPVISTDLGTGTSYVNQDGETGFVVPPGNADILAQKIELLMEDDGLSSRLGRQAEERVRSQFDKDAIVAKTLNVYESVLGS